MGSYRNLLRNLVFTAILTYYIMFFDPPHGDAVGSLLWSSGITATAIIVTWALYHLMRGERD